MRRLALVAALALVGCASASSNDDLLDKEIVFLGAMAQKPGPRTPAQILSITACVTSARLRARARG